MVVKRMQRYDNLMKAGNYRGEANIALCAAVPEKVVECIKSFRIYSNMAPDSAEQIAFTRELFNVTGISPSKNENQRASDALPRARFGYACRSAGFE
jgi:hypothetical protein